MSEKDDFLIDDQLLKLKKSYHEIGSDASLNWARIERREYFFRQRKLLVRLLKMAASIIFFGLVFTVSIISYIIISYRSKEAKYSQNFAVTSVSMPIGFSSVLPPRPGNMSSITSMVSRQKNKMSSRSELNRMPTFTMPAKRYKKLSE